MNRKTLETLSIIVNIIGLLLFVDLFAGIAWIFSGQVPYTGGLYYFGEITHFFISLIF